MCAHVTQRRIMEVGLLKFTQAGKEQDVETHLVSSKDLLLNFLSSSFLAFCVCVCMCVCVCVCADLRSRSWFGGKHRGEKYMLGRMHDRTGMVLEFKVAKAGNTRRAHRRCMHGLRTEGELRRNALGRGLLMKDKCYLVLIHAC
jgi:hypothetical protein